MKAPCVLVIVGPTASGKTPLSLLLAEKLNGEIISADSRQVYKYLDIGTAKPTREELRRVKHHFIDILEPTKEYNAGEYGNEAREALQTILLRKKTPILVGGSGLYLKAVIDGFFEGPGKDPELRNELEEKLSRNGGAALLEELRGVDPETAARMDATKPRRIVRALEVYYATGMPLSKFHAEQAQNSIFEFIQFGLEWDRKELYQRINERVDRMVEQGLLDEVRALLNKGYSRSLNALNTVGYKEMFDYLEGKATLEESVELMKRNTRRFAKRQLTWFRADKRIRWVKCDGRTDFSLLATRIINSFK
ncbi:MAG: tRNA (adenosine(37)-N6)-dimethylallyltransferase MiaA [Ignavibacteriae bacterium]|nr:tRNA (adenosine(37)-N6)-dimethylallyltransferase MiaA [Ignavibacteriota bacterium]